MALLPVRYAVVVSLFLFAGATQVTPIEKVTELLNKLEAQVEEQGKTEAANYDKFACFCKEQADEKLYAIEKSNKKIKKLNGEVIALGTEIGKLSGRIGGLGRKIGGLQRAMNAAQKTRNDQHDSYKQVDQEVTDCIAALDAAIAALKDSKSQMSDVKLDLVQFKGLGRVLDTMSKSSSVTASDSQKRTITALLQQDPASYNYRSNEIIDTLENLRDTFKANKKDLDNEEFEILSAFQKQQLNDANQKQFAEKDKAETEQIHSEKTDEKSTKSADKQTETDDRDADQNFLNQLTTQCQDKATQWDQRSKMRAKELQVLAKAIETLEEKVKGVASANKKLVDLQRSTAPVHTDVPVPKANAKPMSFLQLRGSTNRDATETKALLVQRVVRLLSNAATKQKSSMLSVVATKIQVNALSREDPADHFVKVRGLIKDLVARLKADAAAESKSKGTCDKQMSKAITMRDTNQLKLEEKTAGIAEKEAEKAQTKDDIATLSKEVFELKKALAEATELRADEKEENEKTITDADSGYKAVDYALTILNNFYTHEKGLEDFAQTGYTPPNSDRDGNTVADLAPEVHGGERYTGEQGKSKNIIGILEVIKSDFDRTKTTTEEAESDAESDYVSFNQTSDYSISTKENSIEIKRGEVTQLEDDITDLQDDKEDAEDNLANAELDLEKLKPMCVDGEETWEQRTAAREKEIEALKDAHDILEDWKGF